MNRTGRIVVMAFLIVWTTPALAQEVNGYRIINVTFSTSSPSDLQINRGRLVWKDVDINTSTYYLKYWSGASIVTLDSLLGDVRTAVDGDYIVWNTPTQQVKFYNTRTWVTTAGGTSYNPDSSQPVSVANGRAAFAIPRGGTGTLIRLLNLAASTDTTLDAAVWNTAPSIHHSQVAWVAGALESGNSTSSIAFFDGKNTKTISDTLTASNRGPILRDAGVVWMQESSGQKRVKAWIRDSLLTLAQPSSGSVRVSGYDISGGIAVAGLTDTVTNVSTIRLFKSVPGSFTTVTDSNRIESLHIDNGLVVWESGVGPDKKLKVYTVETGFTEELGIADNPVIDDGQIAWTLGDAVEVRVPVTYEAMTNNVENGWEQSRFKPIDDGNILWGNYTNSNNSRLFYSPAGSPGIRLTDSLVYKDFLMANDGHAIWRLDFSSLWLYDGGSPVRVVDSLQCENMYVAGNLIGFHGFRLGGGSSINQAWIYKIAEDTLIQLTNDTSATVLNFILHVDGPNACWYRSDGDTSMLMFYNGLTTTRLSGSSIGGRFSFRNGVIAWSEDRSGKMQIMMRNVSSGITTQITSDTVNSVDPVTDGQHIVWYAGSPKMMVYYDIATGKKSKVAYAAPTVARWEWLSNGKIAWSGNGEILVYDGSVISQLTNSGGFRANSEPYVDKETIVWKLDEPNPVIPVHGDIYRGKLHPRVAFDAVNITGSVPLTVSFFNRSWQGTRSVSWTFGDGGSSSLENPVHTYLTPGFYSVALTADGVTGPVSETKYGLVRVLSTTGISQEAVSPPTAFSLYQNYPNPFNPSTTIRFDLPQSADVDIRIFDLLGREVATLVHDRREAGPHSVEWDARNFPSGMYVVRFKTAEFLQTKKLMLMK